LRVVGHLNDADAEFLEQAEIADLILDAGDVLPAEDDSGLAFLLGRQNVVGGLNLPDDVAVVAEPGFPAHYIAHGLGKAFPDAAGAIRSGQAAPPHVLEDRTSEIGNDQPVDHERGFMQVGRHNCPSDTARLTEAKHMDDANSFECDDCSAGDHNGDRTFAPWCRNRSDAGENAFYRRPPMAHSSKSKRASVLAP
jgi:hypothetical protein